MSKNITTSSFRNLPGGLLLFLLFCLLTELFLLSVRPELVRDFWNKFLINESVLIATPQNYSYLIMGDSLQKTGINPGAISKDVINLGLPGGKPLSLYLLLKRYLEKHAPPKAIFLYVDPEDAKDSFYLILKYFVTLPEFMSIYGELTWEERWAFISRYLVSLDERNTFREWRSSYPYSNKRFVDDLKRNQGYMPSPNSGITIKDDYFTSHKERIQSSVSFSSMDERYLDRFMRLASSKNIDIIFTGIVIPKQLYAIFDVTGFNKDYISFIERLKRRYPDAYFVNKPALYMDNRYFGDMSHVNKAGSEAYTEYFKKQVLEHYLLAKEQEIKK